MASIKSINASIDILKNYDGLNPFLRRLKKEVIVNQKTTGLSDFAVDYILENYKNEPKTIGKTIELVQWYGEELQEKFELPFTPQKMKIYLLYGETDKFYHCSIKYRQSMEPMEIFLPKKAVMGTLETEDYHNFVVNFDYLDSLSMKRDANRRLLPHQKDGIKFLLSKKRCILADDMGLGKTTTLSASAVYSNFEKIIIICPASLKTNWKNELMWYVPENEISIIESLESKNKAELEKFLGYEEGTSGLKVEELLSMAKERGEWQSNKFIIVNYDILDRYYEITKARSKEGLQKALDNSPLLKEIMDKKSLLIVDEAHRLSVSTSKRYKIIRDLIRKGKPEGVYLATGTPITNNPQNLYCILQLLNHPVTGDYEYYMNTFCGAMKIPAKGEKEKWTNAFLKFRHKNSRYELTPDEMQSLKQYIRTHARMITVAKDATNLEELKKKISDIYLRRTKEDLQKALPPKTIHEVYYDFTMEQLMEYNKLWDEYEAAQLNENPDKELNKDLLEGAIYRKYCSNQMVPNTIKLADEIIANGEKVVIFCAYDEELYTLKKYYEDRAVIYNGKISAKDKDKAIAEFKNNDNVMVFIGNIQAAGVGINLTNACKLIFSNFSFVPGDNSQSMDRCHRIGQTKPVDIYFQIFKGSQYEHMWKTVIRKQLSIDAVIKREEEK